LDRQLGLIPFFICATLGTTGCCSFDKLEGIGAIAARHGCYVHVDAAYAGAAMICEEYRYLMAGIQLVHSFAFNPSKWLQVHFDCSALWVRDVSALHRTFNVNPLYLKHEQTGCAIDFMHWQVALSRRFRSLKLWCVLRNFGLKGLQSHIRRGVQKAELFEQLLRSDPRFSIAAKRVLGLVVFRLNAGNELTELLLKRLNSQGKIHCVPASLKGTYVIRFTVTSARTTDDDIRRDFLVIQAMTDKVLAEQSAYADEEEAVDVNDVQQRSNSPLGAKDPNAMIRNPKLSQLASSFGTSLLLCNSPMTPKLVNGSFAAILDNQDVVQEFVRKFGANCNWQRTAQTSGSTALRRRIKGLMLSDKQYR
jgi:histidine decarboxylase